MMYFLISLFYVDPTSGLPYAINSCCRCLICTVEAGHVG